MLYQVKNLTGDPTNPDSRLWEGVRLYATSNRLQQFLPINPQETVVVSEHAYVELTTQYPLFIQVLDLNGIEDTEVPNRHKTTLSGNWDYVDLERFAGNISITNPSTTEYLYFSFSGFSGAAVAPPASTISEVMPGENIDINSPMSPIRFIYLKGTAGQIGYVLSN